VCVCMCVCVSALPSYWLLGREGRVIPFVGEL